MNWQELLKNKVDLLGRRNVESDLSISRTTLSQLLGDKYPADTKNIERKVLRAYAKSHIDCPVLGQISVARCNSESVKPFSATSPQRVKLYRSCANCPNRSKK